MAKKTTSGTPSSTRKTTEVESADETQEPSPEERSETEAEELSESAPEAAQTDAPKSGDTDGDNETPGDGSADEPPGTEQAEADEADTDGDSSDTDNDKGEWDNPVPNETGPVGENQPEHPIPTQGTAEQVVIRKGGFIPLALGGIVAGLIGFAAGHYVTSEIWGGGSAAVDTLRDEMRQTRQAQSGQVSALSDRIDAIDMPDLSGIEHGQAELRDTVSALTGRIDNAEEQLAGFETRLNEVEARPLSEGASDEAVAAYDAELKALQEAMEAQRAEIEQMTAEARDMEENAEATAQATMRRAALSRIQTALDAGGGYADALADLEATGMTVPDILSRTADHGVAQLAELQASFPDAARAALAAARDAAVEAGEASGFAAFLRTQLGVRSLEPQEGNDPDAILSRAEAATSDGRLTDALAEIEALPETARAELSDWAERATRRLEAVAAAQELSEELN